MKKSKNNAFGMVSTAALLTAVAGGCSPKSDTGNEEAGYSTPPTNCSTLEISTTAASLRGGPLCSTDGLYLHDKNYLPLDYPGAGPAVNQAPTSQCPVFEKGHIFEASRRQVRVSPLDGYELRVAVAAGTNSITPGKRSCTLFYKERNGVRRISDSVAFWNKVTENNWVQRAYTCEVKNGRMEISVYTQGGVTMSLRGDKKLIGTSAVPDNLGQQLPTTTASTQFRTCWANKLRAAGYDPNVCGQRLEAKIGPDGQPVYTPEAQACMKYSDECTAEVGPDRESDQRYGEDRLYPKVTLASNVCAGRAEFKFSNALPADVKARFPSWNQWNRFQYNQDVRTADPGFYVLVNNRTGNGSVPPQQQQGGSNIPQQQQQPGSYVPQQQQGGSSAQPPQAEPVKSPSTKPSNRGIDAFRDRLSR